MEETLERERKWQARWKEAGVGRALREAGRPKYFLLFAYPGSSGFMHLGHMRGFTFADALARFHRMRGERVFFPGGTHASGLPSVTFAGKVAAGDPDAVAGLRALGVDDAGLASLTDPERAARFLGESYWNVWERFGMVMDRSAYVTTIDPDYQQFIRWQFRRLEKGGYLVQKPYFAPFCPRSGPVSVDPSETDLSKGGEAEIVTYTALPFALPDGRALLAATLRPETVFGATNVWIPAGGELVEWKLGPRTYLASEAGVSKLLEQQGGERGDSLPASSLAGTQVRAPLTGESLPVIPSPLVDPGQGTGIVMSVPGHAPADWVAIGELPPEVQQGLRAATRTIITIPEEGLTASERDLLRGEGPPAARAVQNVGVQGLQDREHLKEATERVYRLEFAHGVLSTGPSSGKRVAVAREEVAKEILAGEGGVEIREFSEPVICRCGETVVIRRIPDQWFLAYGSRAWKEETRAHIRDMYFQPPEYGGEIGSILDWYDDRPAVRRGRWLGTPFPQDPQWIIEPIADSTLYPAYYVVRRYVAAGKLQVEQLTQAFFDFVFLGEGAGEPTVPRALAQEVREEFAYWYPVDLNIGGKEHKRVHFPVFLYTHVALLPPPMRPRGIFVYWWLTSYSGEKISKKDVKGGAVPTVDGALGRWGADALRLYYALSAGSSQDVEWNEETCEAAHQRVGEVFRLIKHLSASPSPGTDDPASPGPLDEWFTTRVHGVLESVVHAYEGCDIRAAAQGTFVDLPAVVRRYRTRGGSNRELLAALTREWIALTAPITPHEAEEAHEGMGGRDLVATTPFPDGSTFPSLPASLERERVVEGVEMDLASLLKIWKTLPSGLRIFVAASWKYPAERMLREELSGGSLNISRFMQRAKLDPELSPHLKDLAKYAGELRGGGVASLPPLLTQEEETLVLKGSADFVARRFNLPEVAVLTEEEGAVSDGANRRVRARPGRPALSLQ